MCKNCGLLQGLTGLRYFKTSAKWFHIDRDVNTRAICKIIYKVNRISNQTLGCKLGNKSICRSSSNKTIDIYRTGEEKSTSNTMFKELMTCFKIF